MTDDKKNLAQGFMELFNGFHGAHGTFIPTGQDEHGKMKGKHQTLARGVTQEDWQRHLDGKAGVGIIPLNDHNCLWWGAIDIDIRLIDHAALEKRIQELSLPMIVCQSRSGAAHVLVFFKEDAPAKPVQEALAACAALLGHPGVEIFPKQVTRDEATAVGNWLNMPYFGNSHRHAFRDGAVLTATEFLEYAQTMKVSFNDFLKAVSAHQPKTNADTSGDDEETPPHRAQGRNDYLFKNACLLKNRGWPDEVVRQAIHALNLTATEQQHANFSQGALDEREVESILKSVSKYPEGSFQADTSLSVEDAIDFMNGRHAIVMDGGKSIVIKEDYDKDLNRHRLNRSSFADIKNFYSQKVLVSSGGGAPKFAKLGHYWLDHAQARRYDGIEFDPSGAGRPNYYNLWRGFGVEAKEADWSLFREHLFKIVCSGNREHYDYLIGWMAYMVQSPMLPAEVAVVIKGERGTGKTTVGKALAKICGQHAVTVSNSRHLLGNFNAHLLDVIFVLAEEAFWAGDKQGDSTLKTLITGETVIVEKKGVDAREVINRLHIMITTNADWAIPTGDYERRFFVLKISDERMQDREYFKLLNEQMEKGGYQGLLHHLLNLDLSGFDVRYFPKTEELQKQWINSLSAVEKWWLDTCEYGWQKAHSELWPCEIRCDEVVEHFSRKHSSRNSSQKSNETIVGTHLKKVGVKKVIHNRDSYYQFPPLAECRKRLEKNGSIEWPDLSEGATETQEEIPF